MTEDPSDARFPTTRWSRVIAAGDVDVPAAAAALAELCAAYWYPLYAYIRRRGHDPEAARDLTQGYFARLLEHRPFAAADASGAWSRARSSRASRLRFGIVPLRAAARRSGPTAMVPGHGWPCSLEM
jgi:RNA polymerase sigma-70 factor (ECF subfamily)